MSCVEHFVCVVTGEISALVFNQLVVVLSLCVHACVYICRNLYRAWNVMVGCWGTFSVY